MGKWIFFKKRENKQTDAKQPNGSDLQAGGADDAAPEKDAAVLPEQTDGLVGSVDAAAEHEAAAINDDARIEEDEDAPFVDTEGKKKRPWSKKKKIIFSVVAVILVAVLSVGAYALSIWFNPLGGWKSAGAQLSEQPTVAPPTGTPTGTQQVIATPEPTIDPYDELLSKADMEFLDDIINIMLIGVDYAEERETWKGKKAYHADVMIILSINTKTNEINMISLPRDTYAKIPGVKGIYKLNASIDCGGGWPKESGFMKVCEAASWMLGGKIPIEYYYAVDMSAVKQLVDKIGGIDFDVEFNYKMQGRVYKKGFQHLDGQAVLDYLRVRHLDSDLKRTGRQRKVLVAIFEKVKNTGDIFQIPDILAAFDGNFFTNTNFGQTAGLAAYFYKEIDSSKIILHTMSGRPNYNISIFNWNFLITDQKKRVDLINKVFGIKVKQYADFTYESASFLWESMQAEVITEKAGPILKKVKEKLDQDDLLPEKPEPPSGPDPMPDPPPGGWKKYGSELRDVHNLATSQYEALKSWKKKYSSKENTEEYKATNIELKKNIEKLCSKFSIKKPDWRVNYEKKTNQIKVDFR